MSIATGETGGSSGLSCVLQVSSHNHNTLRELKFSFPTRFLRDCDGVLTSSTRVFEPESNDVFKAYYEKSGRSYYVLGPITPKAIESIFKKNPSDKSAVDVFLDKMQARRGEHSVLFVSILDRVGTPMNY